MKAVLIAGTHSGCGKTTVSLGMMAAYRKKGLSVQGFKAGPDYIDQGLHGMVTGRAGRNLDTFMMSHDFLKQSFYMHTSQVDVSVVEGVMGIFDGDYGTWSLAKLLKIPVVLVVDAFGMAETAGYILKGVIDEAIRRDIQILGCIFTNTGSPRHLKRLKSSSPIPVFGSIPRDERIRIASRHLGLLVAEEKPLEEEAILYLAELVDRNVDLEEILRLSMVQGPLEIERLGKSAKKQTTKTIAIAKDKAFCFYYQENLDAIVNSGFRITYFSPLNDEAVPNCDSIYIGGGYPELYSKIISNNKKMLNSIHQMAMDGIPIYAECGGLIFLSQGVARDEGLDKMVGLFPFTVIMGKKPNLGYRKVTILEDCFLGRKEETYRGHEFHYTYLELHENLNGLSEIFNVKDQYDIMISKEGFKLRNTIATYIHLHFNGKSPFENIN